MLQGVSLLIVCATVTGCTAIICYTVTYLMTNPTIIKAILEVFKD